MAAKPQLNDVMLRFRKVLKARTAAVLTMIWVAIVPIRARAASIHTEIHVDVPPAFAWAAIRDVGAVHTRQARGFVVNTVFADGVRTVTFRDGVTPQVVKERIVTIDDQDMRVVYGAIETRAIFHAASLQVLADGNGCKLVWITDVLPEAFKDVIRHNMELGMAAMKKTLEEDVRKEPAR